MTFLESVDRSRLATAVVDSMVVAVDPVAPRSCLFYWENARPFTDPVIEAFRIAKDPVLQRLGARLLADPGNPGHYADLYDSLLDPAAIADQEEVAALFALAWTAESNSRLGHHLGSKYARQAPAVTAQDLATRPSGRAVPAGADPEVLIVVPFRDRNPDAARLRNLLACLHSLRDQSFPRERYHVVVVESDATPRWREVISPHTDHYLFAAKPNTFNKSWAVNAGVMNTPGRNELICILDADVLADRDFVARNVARFERPGTGGHLTYRDMYCMDDAATDWAIGSRLDGAPTADPDHLRGFVLRRPPGCCLWVRSSVYRRIGGMDERYEGWGGEDNDFLYRFDFAAPLDSYDDWLLHMTHPSSSVLREGGELINDHIPPLSWNPGEPIGRLDRFAPAPAVASALGGGE
jgi:hypothetical protein